MSLRATLLVLLALATLAPVGCCHHRCMRRTSGCTPCCTPCCVPACSASAAPCTTCGYEPDDLPSLPPIHITANH
jgi:hypothetical protein